MSQRVSRRSPWRDVLAEVTVQQQLIEDLLHPAGEADGDSRCPSPVALASAGDASRSPPWSRTAARPTWSRALISPSPDRQPSRYARESESHAFAVAGSLAATSAEDRHRGQTPAVATGSSRAVEALVEALSTSSWSSDGSTAATSSEGCRALAPFAVAAPLDRSTRLPPDTRVGATELDLGTCRRGAAIAARFYVEAARIVACEFETRQRIVFDEFTQVTEIVSRFVCRVTLTPHVL